MHVPDQVIRPKQRKFRSVAGTLAVSVTIGAAVFAGFTLAQADDIGGWELEALNVHEAWDVTQGDGVTIAVIDTGVAEHPYFDGKDILPGHSLFDEEDDGRNDHHGHGTSVAASALSVAPEATLLPVQSSVGEPEFLEDHDVEMGRPTSSEIEWAVDNDADVIVLAWVTSIEDQSEQEAIQYAMENDVIVIGGAGNDPDEDIWWPAAFNGVLAVTGTDMNNELYSGSSTGDTATVAAPATDITTASVEGDSDPTPVYEQAWGTSIAAGLTGGVAALVLASDTEVDANNAIARMTGTAVDLGESGWDPEFGYGLLNAAAAVNSDINDHQENPLGYPMSVTGHDEPDEDLQSGSGENSSSDNPVQAQTDDIFGIPPLLFWGIAIFILLDFVLIIYYHFFRRKKKNQRPPT